MCALRPPRRLSVILILSLVLSGCLPIQRSSPVPTPTVGPSLAETGTVPDSSPTPLPPATQTPTPTSPPEPTSLSLGDPFWIGRGKIAAAAFLPGAQQMVIAWASGVSLHVVETGRELWFQPVPSNLIAFDVQPQGEQLAAALADGSLVLFTLDGEAQLVAAAKPKIYWGDVAWSPDGKTLAFQFIGPNRSDPISLLDVASGQIEQVPDSHTGSGVMPALVWSPDGSAITVAALGDETCPRFVDVQTGEDRMRLGEPGQCYPIPSLRFLPDGRTLAVRGQAGGLDLLRYPDGARVNRLQDPGVVLVGRLLEFPAAAESLFTDPDGQWIAARGGFEPCYCGNPHDQPDHPLVVWDLARGVVQARLEAGLEPLAQIHRLAAAFDGESILMLYASGEITRWAFNDPQAEETLVARVPSRPVLFYATLTWSAGGSHLAFTGRYGGVDVYETAAQRLVRSFEPPLVSPALSPDGQMIALYDPEKKEQAVYRVQDSRLIQTLPAAPVLMGAAFSPDGEYLAYGAEARASVAELASGQVTTLDPAPAAPVTPDMSVTRLIWAPDGQALATVFAAEIPGADDGGLIVLWKRQAGGSFQPVYHVANFQANYQVLNLVLAAYNPSGALVALQSLPKNEAGQRKLVVYDLENETVIQTFPGYTPGAWVNDEELLAAEALSHTRSVRINMTSGDMTTGSFLDSGGSAYAPGGIFIAQNEVPPRRGISIWHWQSGEVVAQGELESLNLVEFGWSPDGRWLVAIGDDGTIRVWSVQIH